MTDIDRNGPDLMRRALLAGSVVSGGIASLLPTALADAATKHVTNQSGRNLPLNDPAFNVKTLGRLQGDLSGKTIYSYVTGQVFGLVPADGPALADYGRLMYRIEGGGIQMSRERTDGAVEERSRGWMFYLDPETGAYLDTFENPYTGDTVAVPTFRGGISGGVMTVNGPEVSANFTMESTVFNRPVQLDWRFVGDQAFISRHAFTRWKESSTGVHKTEMTLDCWNCRIADIANEKLTMIPNVYSWTSQTEWQSWLKMRGKPGAMLWRNEGVKVKSLEALPRAFVEQSDKKVPGALRDALSWT
ncbi:MAG: DUF1838 family protein [Steroidobacteraceae bacterium]|nr:DUF1838 family protein [Steroidobacteraceae bacterium]